MSRKLSKGQIEASAVIGIVILLVSVAIGGIMYSKISGVAGEQAGGEDAGVYTTDQREFNSVSAWTLENTGALKVSHTGENIRLYSTDAENGAGTVTVSQTLDIQIQGDVESGLMETSWFIENADNFLAENTYLRLRDPDGNIEAEIMGTNDSPGVTSDWAENQKDVTDDIDEEGKWTLEMFFESQDDGDGLNAYIDNSELDVDTETIGESTKDETDSGANVVFPLMVLIVIVGVFVMLIGVLRTLG